MSYAHVVCNLFKVKSSLEYGKRERKCTSLIFMDMNGNKRMNSVKLRLSNFPISFKQHSG